MQDASVCGEVRSKSGWHLYLHLYLAGHYTRWFAEAIKDPALSAIAADVAARTDLTPRQSRASIAEAIPERYTLPARP